MLTAEKYKGTEQGDTLLGFATSLVPQCGYAGLAIVLPLAITSVFMNANVPLNLNSLVDSQPSWHKIQSLVSQNAVDTVLLTQESISENPNVYISCDKGNKKGNKNLAKYICWFDKNTKTVKTYLTDVDCTDEVINDIQW